MSQVASFALIVIVSKVSTRSAALSPDGVSEASAVSPETDRFSDPSSFSGANPCCVIVNLALTDIGGAGGTGIEILPLGRVTSRSAPFGKVENSSSVDRCGVVRTVFFNGAATFESPSTVRSVRTISVYSRPAMVWFGTSSLSVV